MRRFRFGLLGRFTVASVVPIAGLGLVLGHALSGQIRERAVAAAMTQTQLLADVCVAPLVPAGALASGLTGADREGIDEEFQMLGDMDVARLAIVDPNGRVLYANDPGMIGHTIPIAPGLGRALGGELASETTRLSPAERASETLTGDLLTVYVPLHPMEANGSMEQMGPAEPSGAAGGHTEMAMAEGGMQAATEPPAGAFEVSIPYAPIEAAIARDVRALYLYLAGGLVVLYLALASILFRARRHEYFALHDSLTGLPNRRLFRDRVEQAARSARRDGTTAAVLILDLDRFKNVNDTLGHSSGDLVLAQVSERLRAALPDVDTVGRLGGDEFAILLPNIADAATACAVAETLMRCFADPFEVDQMQIELSSSVGIAMLPTHGTDVETLLRKADIAMYTGKGARTGPCLYSSAFDRHSPAKLMLVGELRRALQNDELVVHYQPQVAPSSGETVGVEALVRWDHPRHGLLMPHSFIPLAEDTSLIQHLTAYVLAHSLTQRRLWAEAGVEVALAINVSVWDLLDASFPALVRRLLAESGTPPGALTLEVTETVILHDRERAQKVFAELKQLGVRVSLDDFGRGYTSLGRIKEFAVDQIKIDRSFLSKLDVQDAAIIRSAADLGRSLGMEVVAEGVESQEVLDIVSDLGCDLVQGYFLGRPMPASELHLLSSRLEVARVA